MSKNTHVCSGQTSFDNHDTGIIHFNGAGVQQGVRSCTERLGEGSADHGALSGIHLAQLRAHIHTCVENTGILLLLHVVHTLHIRRRRCICFTHQINKNQKENNQVAGWSQCYRLCQCQTCVYFVVAANTRNDAGIAQTCRNLAHMHTQNCRI